jgi:NADP-reducing hydrogenase subunit HndB
MKLSDLKKIREKTEMDMRLRDGNARIKIVIDMGTSGIAAGARETLKAFLTEVENRMLKDVIVNQTGERGLSSHEPVVTLKEEGKADVVYGDVTVEVARKIVAEHIVNGRPVSNYVLETA